jgi:hypothetical protein
MEEITISITEAQKEKLIQMLNMVQVRLSEAPDMLDLKKRIEEAQAKTQ